MSYGIFRYVCMYACTCVCMYFFCRYVCMCGYVCKRICSIYMHACIYACMPVGMSYASTCLCVCNVIYVAKLSFLFPTQVLYGQGCSLTVDCPTI